MAAGYTHGTHACTLCHPRGEATTVYEHPWQLVNWPAYWGDGAPDVLVLGFSMGANQVRAAREKAFDKVAFDRLRPRLRLILEALGIPLGSQTMDDLMSARSNGLGFSSLSRCSLGLWDGRGFKTSGKMMKTAPTDPWAGAVLTRCCSAFLPGMPPSVRRVVLLGVDDDYVRGVRQILRKVFLSFSDVNDMAFRAGGRTWVFAVHPSRESQVAKWLSAPRDSKSGRKRERARAAIAESYREDSPASRPTTIGQRRLVKRADASTCSASDR